MNNYNLLVWPLCLLWAYTKCFVYLVHIETFLKPFVFLPVSDNQCKQIFYGVQVLYSPFGYILSLSKSKSDQVRSLSNWGRGKLRNYNPIEKSNPRISSLLVALISRILIRFVLCKSQVHPNQILFKLQK